MMQVRVHRKWREAEGACGLELRAADGQALPAFTAGAHIDVMTPAGVTRQYSLCNAPGSPDAYEICVLRDEGSRGGSRSMHDSLRVDDVISASAPKNHFALHEGEAPAVLIAGGIGITPILSMTHALASRGTAFEVHHASRSRERAAFASSMQALWPRQHHLHVAGSGVPRLDIASLVARHRADAHFYVCGPASMIEAVQGAARDAGVAPERVHFERFAAPETSIAKPPSTDDGFELFLARSLRTVQVGRSETLLAAIRRAGVGLPTSCEQGVCGTCMTRVLEGAIDHQDYYLSDDEKRAGDVIIPCCSRATSPRLVLDL